MSNPQLLSQFYVKIDGADASEEFTYALVEITVENSVHMPDVATLVMHDPHLHWIDDPLLSLGKAVEVSAKSAVQAAQSQLIFDGEIVEIEPEFATTHRLIVRAFDRLHRLARGRHVRSFQNVTDSDLAQRIAKEAGLQADVQPTTFVHPYLLQNNETNLEFLSKRSRASGCMLYVDRKKLYFKPPAKDRKPIELRWGATLTEFRPRLTTVAQINTVTARGWDPSTRGVIVGQASKGKGLPEIGQNTSGGDVAQSAFNIDAPHLVSTQPLRSQADADHLAQVTLDRQAGRFVQAEGTCGGNPAILAGSSLNIGSVGDRFNGTYFVTTAVHVYNAHEGYSTRFSISGQTPHTLLGLLRRDDDAQTPNVGLVIGVVTDNQDPKGWGRVKVKYPCLSDDHTSDWARLLAVGGGPQRGIQFLPEINDEVLVGFEMGDVHHAFVMGGLWNGRDSPPKKSSELISGGKVQQRLIRSRSGHCITLDDNESSSSITIEDKAGNKIILDSRQSKLLIEAQGQVEIRGIGVKIDAGAGTVDVTGSLINLN